MTFERELLKGSTESIILSLLVEEPLYGYQLAKNIEKNSKGYFKLRGSTLYPALHRLEKDGMISGQWKTMTGQQQRRYYFITEKGQEALTHRAAHWQDFARALSMILHPEPNATT